MPSNSCVVTSKKQNRRSREFKAHVEFLLFLLPSLLFLVLFTYLPIVRSVVESLMSYDVGSRCNRFVGFMNYSDLFSDPVFWKAVSNNLVYAVCTVIPTIALSFLFAVILNTNVKFQGFYRLSLFYPSVLPMAAASMVWVFLFNPAYGIINHALARLGFEVNADWLNEAPYALVAIIIVGIWKYVGYYMLFFLAGLQGIDNSLYEAADIEGATKWDKFCHITFPLMTPTTFMVGIVAAVNSFQAVDQVHVMTRGGPFNSTNMLMYYIYQNGFLYWNTGLASAASVFLFAILLIGTGIYFTLLNKKIQYER